MKKVIIILFVVLLVGYLGMQYGSLWILKLMSLRSGTTTPKQSNTSSSSAKTYKDGTYTGNAADALYGNIQVKAVISGGKIIDIQFVQYPRDRARSIAINTLAMPNLKQEAITAQSASVDIVSGATDSSQAFIQSLNTALSQAI